MRRRKIEPALKQRCRQMNLGGGKTVMMTGVMVQSAQFLMLIERVIQFVRRRHRADPQQQGSQEPGDESRFSFYGIQHSDGQSAAPARQRQAGG